MRRRLFALSLAVLCWPWSGAVLAQSTAEQALHAGNWQEAAQLAEAELARGGLKPERWTALQRSLGMARAQLGAGEQAQRAFLCALALDPGLRLASDEAVEVRSPFMEARGFWSLHPERLGASAALSDDGAALLVALVDPAALISRVVVRARGLGQRNFVEWSLAPAASVPVSLEPLASPRGVEYSVTLIDENANRLWQLGSDAQPLRIDAPHTARPESATPVASAANPARPYYVGAAVSLLVAAGALAVAGVSHAERQQLAQDWNSGNCAGDGSTRGAVCGHEHDQIERYQRLAIGFYSVAGAGLVAGIVTLIAAPRRTGPERRSARATDCQAGPGLVGLQCTTRF